MVGIPEKTAYKPLNAPEPLVVKENVSGLPIKIGKGNLAVAAVEDRWRIDDEWLAPGSSFSHVLRNCTR